MRTRYWIVGGVVVIVGITILASNHHPATVTPPQPTHHHVVPHQTQPKPKTVPIPIPKKTPTLPTNGTASGRATASFTTVTGQGPPMPLQVVSLPWQPSTQWAVEPLGMAMHGNSLKTLWFGQKTGTSPWQWIPTTLPGVPSTKLPAPIQQAITMAYSLHLGESGPTNTVGNISWQGIQGQVGSPEAWTLSRVGPNSSPLFAPTVGVVVFDKSLSGNYTGYYGLEAAFDTQNASNGLHGLVGFVSRQGSLPSLVASPPPLL